MEMNLLVIIGVSIVAFSLAPVWFGALFGNLWMKIHGSENKTKQELKKEQEGMGKLLALEGINTFIMVACLSFLIINSSISPVLLALLIWLGFLYPNIVSGVIWWADKKEFWLHKIAILWGFNLIMLLVSSVLLSIFL